MKTLSQILLDDNATLDLDASLPVNDELALRTSYADQAVWDATAIGQLHEFTQEYVANISTGATLPLPRNFRELEENPQMLVGASWVEFPVIQPKEKFTKSPGDKYCYVLGNPAGRYNLIFNQPVANATVSILMQRYPSGFATLTDICELSDPMYVVRKVESYVLYGRGDDKYPLAEQRANTSLSNMVARGKKGAGGQSLDARMKFRNPLASGSHG